MSSANFLFLLLVIFGPLVSISSGNWLICWGGMELSFLALIPLLFWGNKYFSLSKEASMKYFCIQAFGSGLLFISGLIVFSESGGLVSHSMLILSIFIKLGIFPMHFWVPGVIAGLDWFSIFVVLTIQKVAPYAFLILMTPYSGPSVTLIICTLASATAVVGALIGNNQTDLRAMLGASSIAHGGWLILGCVTGYMWGYFFIYCLSFSFTTYFLLKSNHSSEVGLGILALSGLPPFFMFLGKWGVLMSTIQLSFPMWLVGVFLVGAVLSLNFYLKFSYSFLLNSNSLPWFSSGRRASLFFLAVNSTVLLFFLVL